jgi:hypothetical protein
VKIPATLLPLVVDVGRRETPSLLKQLQVGQTLQAQVLSQLQPGLLRLQIATTELLARSQLMLPPGQRLQLEVIKGQPLPELRILPQVAAPDRQQLAVRSALARQLPPAEVRAALRSAIGEASHQAAPVRQREAAELFSTILRSAGVRLDQLNPATLRHAIRHSGLLHEARLATVGMPPDAADNKTQQLQLLQLLIRLGSDGKTKQKDIAEPPPNNEQTANTKAALGDSLINRLMRLVEGSLARIQLQQAASLPNEEGQRQVWQLDLPIQLPDQTHEARLRIEREASGGDQGETASWAVNLAFQFDTIGGLQCRIVLAGERVSTTFWSDRASTHERVGQRLPVLREAFEAQGLEVVHLGGVLGEPTEPLISVPVPDSLLDERA